MALEAAIYSQDPFGYAPLLFKDYCGGFLQGEDQQDGAINNNNNSAHLLLDDKSMFIKDSTATPQQIHGIISNCYYSNHNSSSPEPCITGIDGGAFFDPAPPRQEEAHAVGSTSITTTTPRRKRRRTKNTKNKEEIENQRMTHIAVERNRRKQMNEYLALLRSLMPPSYVQRGDQASIIGGAINFVKELEQLLQSMEAHKLTAQQQQHAENDYDDDQAELGNGLFAEFFSFPQYSTRSGGRNQNLVVAGEVESGDDSGAVGEIEVTMVESHVNVKILARKQQRQLLKLVAGLQSLRATILHLNVTTASDQMVLYSISLKMEEGCHLNTVDEIAAAVNQMLRRIEEGSCCF